MTGAIDLIHSLLEETAVQLPENAKQPVAIVGAGAIVEVAHLPAYAQLGLPIAAIYDLNPARAKRLADRFGITRVADSLDDLLSTPDVEVVDIAVVPSAQPDILRHALAAGKHVLAQKPFATSDDQAEALLAVVKASGRTVAVNQQLRFEEGIAVSHAILGRGLIGEPTAVRIDVDISTDWSAWPWLVTSTQLDLFYHSIHYLDAIRFLVGDPERVFGTVSRRPGQFATGETRSISTLVYPGELRAVVTVNHENLGRDPRAEFRIDGTLGSIRGTLGMLLDYPHGQPDTLELLSQVLPTDGWLAYPISRRWIPDAFAGTMVSLLTAIATGTDPLTAARDNVRTIRLVTALYRSAETGEAQRMANLSTAIERGQSSGMPSPCNTTVLPHPSRRSSHMSNLSNSPDLESPGEGAQRLSLERLHKFEALGYGMFIHFGMSTFDGQEMSSGDKPSSWYQPEHLDVDQWVQVAADSGMRYAVLTAKHVAGFCLWPTEYNDYHVGSSDSGNRTDVVEAFVRACETHGVVSGVYYCSWDNHNRFGSVTPTFARGQQAFTTRAYRDFQFNQLEELSSRYGAFGQYWIDIPSVLGPAGRREQYDQLVGLAPDAMIVTNSGFAKFGNRLDINQSWPSDAMEIERAVPSSTGLPYDPWHELALSDGDAAHYYLPGEVCETIGQEWFAVDDDLPRSDAELLGIRLLCRERESNLLLNVPPSREGRIESHHVDALARLCDNLERF